MDIKLHTLSELSESLLDQVPQSIFKVKRKLPHIHALLSKYMLQKSHLKPSAEIKAKELLMGTSYNPSNIEAMIHKLSSDIHLFENLEDDNSQQDPSESIKKFHKLIIQSSVDTLTQNTIFSAKSRQQNKFAGEWETIKAKIIDSRGIDYFTVPSPKRQKNLTDIIPPFISSYNSLVSKYFHAKLEGKPYNMVYDLMYLEQSRKELDRENLEVLWRILDTQVESMKDNESLAEGIIDNTCGFFERLFVERVVETTREEGLKRKMLSFAVGLAKRIPNYRPESDAQGLPIWAVIYSYFRGGLLNEMIDFANSTALCREYTKYFIEYRAEKSLSQSSLTYILGILNSGENIDLLKRAVLVIIAKANEDLDELQENSLEDYLWLKLKLVNTCDEATAEHLEYSLPNYSILLLPELQKYIIECGPAHFNNSVSLYTTALMSCLCYGEAVMHLYKIPEYATEALHLALILKESQLLPTFSSSELLFDDIEGITHVNFTKMLCDYIKGFSSMLPNESLIYISFMPSSQSIITESSNLVIGYENYQIVLNPEVYIFSAAFRKSIGESNYKLAVETIAEYAVTQKSPEASVLFDSIGNYQNVLKTWINEMKFEIDKLAEKWRNEHSKSWSLNEERGTCEKINYPARVYAKLYEKYKKNGVFERFGELDFSISVLNCVLTFYNAVSLRQFRHSLYIISSAQVLPLRPAALNGELFNRCKALNVEVKEELPRLIVNCLEVQLIMLQKIGQAEIVEYKRDMESLMRFYNELSGAFKGIPAVESRFKQFNSSFSHITSNYMIN